MEIKDLILISAYCDTKEKENVLRNLVTQCKEHHDKFDVMIVSHKIIPVDICEKVNFVFYDYKNEILLDWNMRSTPWFNPNDDRPILSCFTGFSNIHLAIWRMLIIGNSIAKNCGYNKIHHLEYDCDIVDFSELYDNSSLLNEYDAISYIKTVNTVDPILFGTYQAYNLNKLPKELLELNEDKIKKDILESHDKSAERMLFELLNHQNKMYVKSKNLLDLNNNSFGLSHNKVSNGNIAWCLPYYDELTEKLGFVVWNYENDINNIDVKVIYNDNIVINFNSIKPKHWVYQDIDDFKNAKKMIVILNDKIRNTFDFEKDKELFCKVSYRQKNKK